MKPQFVDNLFGMLRVDVIFLNRILLLAFILLFFTTILLLHRVFRRNVSVSRVGATIKLALFGLLILLLGARFGEYPAYARIVDTAGNIILMLCLANLAAYAVIDIYIFHRTRNKFPSFSRDLVTLVIYLVFAIVSLRVIFRIDVTSILTTTTVITAAVAFAMQSTLASIVSGFSIQKEEHFRQGTWISVQEKNIVGEIVNVGFRYTTLRTPEAHHVMVPNSMLLQSIVVNYGNVGHHDKSPIALKVGLGYEVPPDRGKEILRRVLATERGISRTPPPVVEVQSFQASSIDYLLRFFIDDFSTRNAVIDSVLRHVWYAVRRSGHDFPYQRLELFPAPPVPEISPSRDEVLRGLRSAEILASFGDRDFAWLAERVTPRLHGAGEVVVRQGEEGDSLFIVTHGALRALVDDAEVGRLREGDVFGEMSLLTGQKRSASVVAETEACLIEVRKADIGPILRANADLLEALSELLAERQEANVDHLRRLELAEAGARKKAFLKSLKAFFGI